VTPSSSREKPHLRIFSKDVELTTPVTRAGHERPFAVLAGVEQLHYNYARGLSRVEMARCASALIDYTDWSPPGGAIVQILVYTTDEEGSEQAIPLAKTHGFSVVTSSTDLLTHYYFEQIPSSRFAEVRSFSMPLYGPFNLDDVRLLHFAGSRGRGLPSRSTIYEFNRGTWPYVPGWARNTSLRVEVLRDPNRNWGAQTLGLYGSALYLALTRAEGEFCGGNEACPRGKDSDCGLPPGGPDMVCGALPTQGDVFVDVDRGFRQQGIHPGMAIDFALLRQVQLSLSDRGEKGRKIIGDYYVAALFMKLDRERLETYARALPHVDRFLRDIARGSDDSIIVTHELRDFVVDTVSHHRDVQNKVFQEVLDRAEAAAKWWCGKTKGQLIQSFG
jgi:hypothetical protein